MKALLTALLAIALAVVCAGEATALPRLSAEPDPDPGGRIVDSRGREVLLRGRQRQLPRRVLAGHRRRPDAAARAQRPGADRRDRLERRPPDRLLVAGRAEARRLQRALPRPGREVGRPLPRRRASTRSSTSTRTPGERRSRPGPDEVCPAGYEPAFGWDGAPGWATLDEGEPRCFTGAREVNPAVSAAWANFFADAPGPGGVGIQTRYARMLAHVAERFAGGQRGRRHRRHERAGRLRRRADGAARDLLRALAGGDPARRAPRRRIPPPGPVRAERALVADRPGPAPALRPRPQRRLLAAPLRRQHRRRGPAEPGLVRDRPRRGRRTSAARRC